MSPRDALAVLYSYFIDDAGPTQSRFEVRHKLDEVLERPLDMEEATEYDRLLWAKQNMRQAALVGVGGGGEEDPFLAKPRGA